VVTSKNSEQPTTAQALIDDPDYLRVLIERAVQAVLEAEMTAHLGAGKYERGEGRTGYRNGTKPRTLVTRVGTLRLAVPRNREGTFSIELFAREQRSEQALVATLMEMYLQGVSTRKVAAITEELCGTGFSKSQVSALASRLDGDFAAWILEPLVRLWPSSRARWPPSGVLRSVLPPRIAAVGSGPSPAASRSITRRSWAMASTSRRQTTVGLADGRLAKAGSWVAGSAEVPPFERSNVPRCRPRATRAGVAARRASSG
jgi:hypothetical protein